MEVIPMLPASEYNAIDDLDEDVDAINDETLALLGKLILEHHLEGMIAVGMLHRHFELYQGELMVHVRTDEATSICRPFSSSSSPAFFPASWFLSGDHYQPFEYISRTDCQNVPELCPTFASSAARLLKERAVHNLTLISMEGLRTEDENSVWIETVGKNRTTLSRRVRVADAAALSTIPTCWSFSCDEARTVQFRELKRCARIETGLHMVKDSSGREHIIGTSDAVALSATPTCWSFSRNEARTDQSKVLKRCARLENGLHMVKDFSESRHFV